MFMCFLCSTRECVDHMETSQVPIKGCNIQTILVFSGIRAGQNLCVPRLLRHGTSVLKVSSEGPVCLVTSYDKQVVHTDPCSASRYLSRGGSSFVASSERLTQSVFFLRRAWDTFCLFICLFGVLCPTRESFTHMETSPLLVKECKF